MSSYTSPLWKLPAETLAIYIIRGTSLTFCYIASLNPFPVPPLIITKIHMVEGSVPHFSYFLNDVILLFISALFCCITLPLPTYFLSQNINVFRVFSPSYAPLTQTLLTLSLKHKFPTSPSSSSLHPPFPFIFGPLVNT